MDKIDMVEMTRRILMRTADIPPDGVEPYKRDMIRPESPEEVRALLAENAKLKQECARRRLKIQELEQEVSELQQGNEWLQGVIRAMREGI